MKKLLLLSTSQVHGHEYLQYAAQEIKDFFTRHNVCKILFVPYALKDHDSYYEKVRDAFNKHIGIEVDAIHKTDPLKALMTYKGVFIGGGNTFLLLKTLYDCNLVETIRKRVLNGDLVYMGSSAGTNVATTSISTTNDMPIVYPPTFKALDLVSFNINPHYIEPEPNAKHMGESRELRIKQYHEIPDMPPVVGLREGSLINIEGDNLKLLGPYKAKLFQPNKEPVECKSEELHEQLKCFI